MGPGFVLLFWLVALIILTSPVALLWGVLYLGAKHAEKKRRPRTLRFCKFSLLLLACLIGAVLGFIGWSIRENHKPAVVFQRHLGVFPGEFVADLRTKQSFFADSGVTYMRFKIAPNDLAGLVPGRLEPTKASKFARNTRTFFPRRAPRWWKATIETSWEYYARGFELRQWKDNLFFGSEWEMMAYDTENQICYYFLMGID